MNSCILFPCYINKQQQISCYCFRLLTNKAPPCVRTGDSICNKCNTGDYNETFSVLLVHCKGNIFLYKTCVLFRWPSRNITKHHFSCPHIPTWIVYSSYMGWIPENGDPIYLNTLRPRQNGRHFADDIFKCIFWSKNTWIPIKISLKFVSYGPINNIPALVQIMAWCRPGNKPLSGPILVRLPTHICVTRPQWVNYDATRVHGVSN